MGRELHGFEKESRHTQSLKGKIACKQGKELSASLSCGKVGSGFLWQVFGAEESK